MINALGFDVGSRLIGVAVGNHLTGNARGLGTLTVNHGEPNWAPLDHWHAQWAPASLVVGLPLTLEGKEQPASAGARRFAEWLQQRYRLPVELCDERYSSREAADRFAAARSAGQKRQRDAIQIDALAAAVILEGWLAAQPSPLAL